MSFGILKDNPSTDESRRETARFPNAGWLDGPLVMGRMEQLDTLRELRLARRPGARAILTARCERQRVVAAELVASSGDTRVDEALRELYAGSDAPFCADGPIRIVLHPPGRRKVDRFANRDAPIPWPDRVEGPELLDRDRAARDLPPPRGGTVELELEVDRFYVRAVRVELSCGDPAFDEEAVALFRRAELQTPGVPGFRAARVRA
ncbi:MAG: hypothetical protein H6735_30260 [Alphaproteobacteria bacterium]|nr:hypothetical protein [Alphaproteobacteria bacterium]